MKQCNYQFLYDVPAVGSLDLFTLRLKQVGCSEFVPQVGGFSWLVSVKPYLGMAQNETARIWTAGFSPCLHVPGFKLCVPIFEPQPIWRFGLVTNGFDSPHRFKPSGKGTH